MLKSLNFFYEKWSNQRLYRIETKPNSYRTSTFDFSETTVQISNETWSQRSPSGTLGYNKNLCLKGAWSASLTGLMIRPNGVKGCSASQNFSPETTGQILMKLVTTIAL